MTIHGFHTYSNTYSDTPNLHSIRESLYLNVGP
jgi:hypothetical protein